MPVQTLENNLTLMLPQASGPSQQTLYDLFGDSHSVEVLRQQNLELQARVEELDAFARSVAHDLKGPLGTLACLADLLKTDHARMSLEEQQMSLSDLARVARKLCNVVDELLLLAELREADIVIGPLCMAAIVAEAQTRLAPMVQDYQAEIVVPAAWPAAVGYGPWVEEVWVNYLSNAIKYGGQPPRMELNAAIQSDGIVCFWVRDNGPGIALDDQTRLFEPFTRLHHIRAGGHGLGLSVVRHIVEKLGGQVGVSSAPGHGSVFSFTLPGYRSRGAARLQQGGNELG